MSALNTYTGVWTFCIALILLVFFVLVLLFGFNWVT
jgi:hypothetical protein